MIVRMTGDMSGTRDGGQQWPPRGADVDLPDEEAVKLIGQGMAVPVVVDAVETAVAPVADVEVRGSAIRRRTGTK